MIVGVKVSSESSNKKKGIKKKGVDTSEMRLKGDIKK